MSTEPAPTPPVPFFRLGNSSPQRVTQIGRYRLDSLIAVGGMGSIHFGVLTGAAEFSRLVAIKRLHPQLAKDPLFRVRFVQEARLNARVLHPNVVQLLDVVEAEDELWLIMEYVDGETLHTLQTELSGAGRLLPLDVVAGAMGGVLEGLHAAHETRDAAGAPLRIVHRDVSPQNIMISRCGQAKLIDFGIAKATAPADMSTVGRLVGKVSYMSPEQARGIAVDQRSDVFSAGIVLWETLTGKRLFREGKQSHAAVLRDVLRKPVPAPSSFRAEIPSALDAVVQRALERNPSDRFSTAREFAQALEAAVTPAAGSKISAYVTVFCEARGAARAAPSGQLQALAPAPQTAVTLLATAQEEPTSLALTGVSEPIGFAESRKSLRRRFGPYALPVALVLCSLSAARWAMWGRKPAAERATAASFAASRPLARPGMSGRPVAPVEAPQPRAQHEIASELRTLTPEPERTVAPTEVLPPITLRKGSKHRTPRPRVASPPDVRRQPARAEPIVPERDDCSVATYLGSDGIQHLKDQCL
jgi:serine/threonine-protein kinase